MEVEFDSAQQANIIEFGRLLDSLLETARGQFALVRDARLIDTFVSREAALRFGYEHYGRSAFLVQPIAPLPDQVDDFHLACRA